MIINTAGDKFYYGVRIVTGSQAGAGTDDTGIYLSLIGSEQRTVDVNITNCLRSIFQQSFSRNSYDDLVLESDGDLGEVLVVVLGNKHGWLSIGEGAPWYVNTATVHNFQSSATEHFPCYHWIGSGDEVSMTAHTSESSVSFGPSKSCYYKGIINWLWLFAWHCNNTYQSRRFIIMVWPKHIQRR